MDISRSAKLRKYKKVYQKIVSSPRTRIVKKRSKGNKIEKKRKKPLNVYQKFVRSESKKPKYKNMTAQIRMTAIGKEWRKKKSQKKKKIRK